MGLKRNKKLGIDISLADLSNRIRGFVLDSQIQNANELSELLGCVVISDEVQEREEEESDKRVEKISYLVPLLFAQVHLLSEAAVEYQKETLPEELGEIPDDIWRESRKMMEQVSLSALMGSLSQLVDMGLLEIPRKYK
jgi:hypothetical protein